MTDDRLKKVRAKVERRLRLLVPKMTFQHQRKELENILSFIDSLQEEPVSEDYNEKYKRIAQSESFKDVYDGKSLGDVVPVEEEPVSEELEKEIQEYYDSRREYGGKYNAVIPVYRHQLADIARHFADWQKEQDKQWLAEEHKNIFAKGRESMKQQMMKDAVDGTVFTQLEDGKIMVRSHYFKSEKIKYLDNVKLIIIKEG